MKGFHQVRIGSLSLALLLSGCLFLSACRQTDMDAADGKIRITATTGMVADIARNVAGDRARVKGIIGEGVDPHLYKATTTDVKSMVRADLVFYNGLLLEGKMSNILLRVAQRGKLVYPVTESLEHKKGYVLSLENHHHDPHVWMDVQGWIQATEVVEKALVDFDPEHAGIYHDNARTYTAKLEALNAYAKKTIASIPEKQRVLVTAHDAFNYMGRRYGLEVRGIQGVSTESEAGLKDIENLVTFLVKRKIPSVFVETSVSDKNVRALIEGTRAKGHRVKIGGSLFSDAMGKTGTYEGTYVGMIDHNITTIVRALGGQAPERGLNGKLSK